MTTPVDTAAATALSADRILSVAMATPGEGLGRLVIKRDVGILMAKGAVDVRVNGQPAALLMPGEKVTLYVPAGPHVVSTKAGMGKFTGYSAEASVVADLEKPQTLRVRFLAEQPYMLLEPTAY